MPFQPTHRRFNQDQSPRTIKLAVFIVLLLSTILLVGGCLPKNQPDPGDVPGDPTRTVATSAIVVYFSDPFSRQKTGGPEEALAAAINRAEKSVDMAIYNISLESVVSALIAAERRGVAVRMVMESEAMDSRQAQRLLAAGIRIEGDQREGLMHNKFTVIDGSEVWTGSMNYTSTGAYNDFNNLVRLRSQRIAQNYTVEFEEMFVDGLFGRATRPATPYPQATIDGVTVETYFSPDDGAAAQIIAEIRQAKRSIDFLAYAFTSDPIAEAIFERAAAGVYVRGVFDEGQVQSNTGGEYGAFKAGGYDIRLDGIAGLMHHKVILIDEEVVITGSYNFSGNAERLNDENIVIIHSPGLAAFFQEQFETVYQNGK